MNFCFPPSIVLVAENSENVTLLEAELLRNRSLIHVACAR